MHSEMGQCDETQNKTKNGSRPTSNIVAVYNTYSFIFTTYQDVACLQNY